MILNIIQVIVGFSMICFNNLSAFPATTFQRAVEAPKQVFYLQPVNEDNMQKFLEEMDLSGAQQAWQAGLCSSENEVLEKVRVQTKKPPREISK